MISLMEGLRRGASQPRWSLLLEVVLVALSNGQTFAQDCRATGAAPLRIENLTGVSALLSAVNCTDGGIVDAVWAGVVTLDEPISIGTGTFLNIVGEDARAEVQGGSRIRLFDISAAGGLSLTQLKLSNGTAESGGAIFSSAANVSIDSCVFEGNVASDGDGGAVWAKGGELTIVGGEFFGNRASRNGGAVWASEAGLVVRGGTRLEENQAGRDGGGLYFEGASENSTSPAVASCSLSEAVFRSNNASASLSIDYDSILSPWVQLYGGGGCAFYRGMIAIVDSVFESNYAELSGGGIYGGIASDMTINGCTFDDNITPGFGGGMAASTATLGGGTAVTNNSAEGHGAGVSRGLRLWDSVE